MVQNAPPTLDNVEKMCFSYPLNIEYPNTIAFSSIQSGVLMAYSSGKLIIVLSHCKYVKAILSDHKASIISVCFEMRGPHIVACDVNGTFYFWYYNDIGYEKSHVVEFGIPATCISWFPSRREISLSTKKGLLFGGIHNFGKDPLTKLCNRSTFCQFNSDGTLLASHHNNSVVTFYIFSSNPMVTQVAKHLNPVVQFDFHPYLPIFISITTDLNLHIWRLTRSLNFTCTSQIKVNGLCKFIKYPIYYLEKMKTNQKPARIAFIDQNSQISSIKIDQTGKILNENKIHFDFTSSSVKMNLLAAFKTNFGLNAAIIQEDGILIYSKSGQSNHILYHTSSIRQISFQEKENWIFTFDELGSLIVWPVYDIYYSSNIVSHNASHAVWYNDKSLLFLHFGQLSLYDIYTSDINNFQFPTFSHCVEIFVDKNENIYVLTKTNIVVKTGQYEIPEFSHHSFSQINDDHFIIVLLTKATSQFTVFMMPEFIELKCSPRSSKLLVKSIASLTLDSFAVLTEESIEFWNYTKGTFIMTAAIHLPGMKFIQCCSSLLFACDDNNVYLIKNEVIPILKDITVSCITIDRYGNVAFSHQKSFSVVSFPFNNRKAEATEKVIPAHQESDFVIPKEEDEEENSSNRIIKFPYNVMISPFDYTKPQEETFHVIHSTLLHLLEYESLFDFVPRQIPAVPNQCAFHLTFPRSINFAFNGIEYSFSFEGKDHLSGIDPDKRDGFDLFSLRYLYAINESALPLSYFSLWLSFSLHQSEVSDHLVGTIGPNDLTKLYIPFAIHDHKLLVSIVKASVQRTWGQYQKVENVALFLIALGQQLAVSKLYNVIGDTQRGDFFTHDFTTKRFRKSAIKNAYSSLSHGGYEMSAALFILAGEVKTGITVITERMSDPLLAFLVLRLLTNSDYGSELMRWFFSRVRWGDDIIPILVAHLTNDRNVVELFEKALLENDRLVNVTAHGDRRVALFQIYRHLALRRNSGQIILYQVARNLCYDGLAPLAMYLFNFADCPYTVARSISPEKVEVSEEIALAETVKEDVVESSKEIRNFDFGGANLDDVDEWSDSDYSNGPENDDEKEEEKVDLGVTCEVKNEEARNESNGSGMLEVDSIIEKSIRKRSFCLSKILADCSTKAEKDNEAGLFALGMGNVEVAARLFDEEMALELELQLSRFIQFCSAQFLYSGSVPVGPKELYGLCKLLLSMSARKERIPLNYSIMKRYDKEGFAVFSFLGAFVVSLWTYHHRLLYHLLNSSESSQSQQAKGKCVGKAKGEPLITDEIGRKSVSKGEPLITNEIGGKSVSKCEPLRAESATQDEQSNANEKSSSSFKSDDGTKSDSSIKIDITASSDCKSARKGSSQSFRNEVRVLDEVPPPRSLFDIDFSTSRFPDTIPALLQFYLSENLQGLESYLERDRLLIMYMIYSLMLERLDSLHESAANRAGEIGAAKASGCVAEMYSKLSRVLGVRKGSISKIIEFYQLALNCPSLSPPSFAVGGSAHPIPGAVESFIRAVIGEHSRSRESLESIQGRVLKKMPISFVINWKLSADESRISKSALKVPVSLVKGIVVAPLNSNTLVVASSNSVFSVNLDTALVSPQSSFVKSNSNDDPMQVIGHPHLNLVLVISPYNTSFYDFNSTIGTKVCITFKQRQGVKFTCAKFSPNGEKVAIGSSLVEVYFFDFSIEHQSPFETIDIGGYVNSIIWLNYDTLLIVAYISNKDKLQKLVLIDLLSSYRTPLQIDIALNSRISVMEIERRNGFIIFGTKNGKVAIIELTSLNDYRLKWFYDFKKSEVSAIAALNNLFAFGTLGGDVLLVNLNNESRNINNSINMKLLKVQFAVSAIIIEMERIIVAGSTNYLEVWKVGEYF